MAWEPRGLDQNHSSNDSSSANVWVVEPSRNLSFVIYSMSIIITVSISSAAATKITSVVHLSGAWHAVTSRKCWTSVVADALGTPPPTPDFLSFPEITFSWFTYFCHRLSSVHFAGSSSFCHLLRWVFSRLCPFPASAFCLFPHSLSSMLSTLLESVLAFEQGCVSSRRDAVLRTMRRSVICMNNQSISPTAAPKVSLSELFNCVSELFATYALE